MSAAEQAERIRGAGSRRAGLIIFVLEEALQAAGVATVADLAGDFPGSRTNALTQPPAQSSRAGVKDDELMIR